MINPELEKYIDTALKAGMEAASIRHVLISAGWNPQDVDEAIAAQQKPREPAAGPGAAVVRPPETAVAAAKEPASAAGTAAESRKAFLKKPLFIASIGVLVALLAAGAAYAFYAKSRTGDLTDAELLARLPDNLQAIRSATYEGSLDFASEPRQAGAMPFLANEYYAPQPEMEPPELPIIAVPGTPIDIGPEYDKEPMVASLVQSIEEWFPQLPSDLSVRLTAGGSTLSATPSTTDATFHAGVEMRFADFNANLDADFLKKGADLYFRVNKFPSVFLDFSTLKGKWVTLTPEDLGGSAGLFGFFDPSSIQDLVNESRDRNDKALGQMRLVYQIAAEERLVTESAPAKSEKLDGRNTRHFQLTLAKDKLAGFYARATKALQDQYGDEAFWKFDQKTADYLASPAFGKLFDYLKANTTLDLWLDAETGQLAKYSYGLRIVPPPKIEKLKDIQYVLRVTLALKDVNKPREIAAPQDAVSFEDAEILLSGKSREEVLAERQVNNIMSIQSALITYNINTNKYPDTLDGLLITYGELYQMSGNPPSDSADDDYYDSMKLLEKIPLDAYTKQSYRYRRNGGDFVIEYIVNIPADATSYQLADVVNGTNHATSKALSTEKKP